MGKALKRDISSLGIGITSLCNLNCPHCYSRGLTQKSMSLSEVKSMAEQFPNLEKVNLGTGESFLNKDFLKIVDFLESKNIEIALTTNGYTIYNIGDEYIKKFKDVDISLDFPEKELHDLWRGATGTFDIAIKSIEKCKRLNVNISIAMALMNNNYKFLPDFKNLLNKYGVFLRINLYKPVDTKKFLLNYEEFWNAIKLMSDNFKLISNSEPILSLITGDVMRGSHVVNQRDFIQMGR